jgi:hypothetical protein
MSKRTINERIEDGIKLLNIVVNSIVQNQMKKVPPGDHRRDLAFHDNPYCFECTRNQYLAIEILLDPDKFYRNRIFNKLTPDDSNIIWLTIRGDRANNVKQRIRLRFETEKSGDQEGLLNIDIDEGSGFLGNKKYGNQIKSLLNQL